MTHRVEEKAGPFPSDGEPALTSVNGAIDSAAASSAESGGSRPKVRPSSTVTLRDLKPGHRYRFIITYRSEPITGALIAHNPRCCVVVRERQTVSIPVAFIETVETV